MGVLGSRGVQLLLGMQGGCFRDDLPAKIMRAMERQADYTTCLV